MTQEDINFLINTWENSPWFIRSLIIVCFCLGIFIGYVALGAIVYVVFLIFGVVLSWQQCILYAIIGSLIYHAGIFFKKYYGF